MSVALLGLGTASPKHSMLQPDLSEHINCISYQRKDSQKRLLNSLFRTTEIDQRGSVLLDAGDGERPDESRLKFYAAAQSETDNGPTTRERMKRYALEAAALADEAARKACVNAGVEFAAITHLITVSCTGFYAPGVDISLIKSLGLSVDVGRIHVGFMGCHGALNGLRAAHAIAKSDSNAVVLLCAVELCTLHFQFGWNRDFMVANSLFADGAGALVISNREAHNWLHVLATGSHVFADSEDAMSWNIGDHGFEMTLSARVPDLIGEHLAPWLSRWLDRQGVALNDVASWAIHPGGPRILTAVADALKLSESDLAPSRQILAQHGNMSSPTVIFILDRLRQVNAPAPCVILGFGPGLVAEAALLM
ncbi:MAG: type III polyketide synthase [Planctomycetota bacterium]